MKPLFKKAVAIALTLVMLTSGILALVSCTSSSPVVMEYSGVKITADIYEYWMSQYKALLSYTYGYKNTAEFWQSEAPDGRTYEEYVTEQIDKLIMNRLICIYMFDSLGYTLSTQTRESVNTTLDGLINSLADGSKSEFDKVAAKYGIDRDGVKTALLYEAKVSELYYAVYSEDGLYDPTSEEKEQYYRDNYARVKVVLIRTKNKFKTDENGNYVISTDGTSYETEGLTVEERAAKYELIEQLKIDLAAGADFEDILSYSDDISTEEYANGFYFTRTSDYVEGIVDAAFELEVGQWEAVVSEYGTHFVLKYELDEGAYDDEANHDFFTDFYTSLYSQIFTRDMEEFYSDITVYQEEKEKIKLSEVISNWEM